MSISDYPDYQTPAATATAISVTPLTGTGLATETGVTAVQSQIANGPNVLPTGAAKDTTVSGLGTTIPSTLNDIGVPNVNASTLTASLAATSLAAGASNTSSDMTITGTGYSILVQAYVSSGTLAGLCHCRIDWFDSGTGIQVDQTNFWFYAGSGSGTSAHIIRGTGPTRGDQANVFVQCLSTSPSSVTFAYTFLQNSRAYDVDRWVTSNFNVSNLSTPQSDTIAAILGSTAQSLADGGGNDTFVLPLFNGQVFFYAQTQSFAADGEFSISCLTDSNISTNQKVLDVRTDATGRIEPVYFTLPNAQCTLEMINNNATTTYTLEWFMSIQPY
jgi:hypothetical protein